MKKNLGKVLVVFLITVAFVSSVGCKNNADSGNSGGDGGYAPKITSKSQIDVLGSYKSGSKTLAFDDNLTGSFGGGSSGNSRAMTNGSFTWSVNGNTITITQGNETTEARLDSTNGKITIDSDEFTLEKVDISGKTYELIYPTKEEMDAKLTGEGHMYLIKLTLNGSGGDRSGDGTVTMRDKNGIKTPINGTWTLDEKNHLTLSDQDGNDIHADIKFSFGNKAYVMNSWGLQVYQSR